MSHNSADIVYAGIVGNSWSHLYVTFNGGSSWTDVDNKVGGEDDWLKTQGWYDNSIVVHPYNDSIVYMGGIDTYNSTFDNLLYKNTINIKDGY